MGFFKTKEEKAIAEERDEAARIARVRAEQAAQRRADRAVLKKYGLDFEGYSDEELASVIAAGARDITTRMAGSGLIEFGSTLSGNSDQAAIMKLLKVQIEQNWMLMRQNEQLLRTLKRIEGGKTEEG